MPDDERRVPGAGGARRLHEFALFHRKHLGSDEARHRRPSDDAERHEERYDSRRDNRYDRDEKEERGIRERDVGEPHDGGVDLAAEISRERAEDEAENERNRPREKPDPERYPGPVQNARENVPAERIGPERMSH